MLVSSLIIQITNWIPLIISTNRLRVIAVKNCLPIWQIKPNKYSNNSIFYLEPVYTSVVLIKKKKFFFSFIIFFFLLRQVTGFLPAHKHSINVVICIYLLATPFPFHQQTSPFHNPPNDYRQ